MFEDLAGEVSWPGALLIAVVLAIWAFNVHSDRENRQELRLAEEKTMQELAYACAGEDDENLNRCVTNFRKAAGDD